MRLRFSHHAWARMREQGVTREMVETVLSGPATHIAGDTADEYEAIVSDRLLHVVLSAGSQPAIVITVYWVAG